MEHSIAVLIIHWPWFIWVLAAYFIIGCLSLTFGSVEKMLGPLGRFWRIRADRPDRELKDLRRQVDFLAKRVEILSHRDECYFEYMLYDTDYHRRQVLDATARGWAIEHHQTFLEFRNDWLAQRGHTLEEAKGLGFWM